MTDPSTVPAAVSATQVSHRVRRFFLLGRLVFVGLIVAFIISRVDTASLAHHFSQLNVFFIILAVIITLCSLSIAALRWKVLANIIAPGIRLEVFFAFNLIGAFYSQFLPGNISGDVIKGMYLSRSRA